MPPEADTLLGHARGAIVAPAGHGKTELIVRVAALGERTLILTHTHAGVHAIHERLKRLGVARSAAQVDTIAGWALRYAAAFPSRGQPPPGPPETNAEWKQIYLGGAAVLDLAAVKRVVRASYDRVLIDEYQDCNEDQHALALKLADILPTLIFGDPMQGIFEFAGSRLNWGADVYPSFPKVLTLGEPRRWQGKNEALGSWIYEVRLALERGQPFDLASGPAAFRQSGDPFDMGLFFEGIEERQGRVAAIHCNRRVCEQLARSTRGAYQVIEEIGNKRLRTFAQAWDVSPSSHQLRIAILGLLSECCAERALKAGEAESVEDLAAAAAIAEAWAAFEVSATPQAARRVLSETRRHSRMRVFSRELWRDADRALSDLECERATSLTEASTTARNRASATGRSTSKRTLSTPLLLKGLEFDHVLIPNAAHFAKESRAQAKLFYVAISRATRSLTISAPDRWLQFEAPSL